MNHLSMRGDGDGCLIGFVVSETLYWIKNLMEMIYNQSFIVNVSN